MNEIVFTSSALLDLLTQIEELDEYDISVSDQSSEVIISIGQSTYSIPKSNAEDVPVDSEAVEDVSDICQEGYEQIDDTTSDTVDSVEGGLLKEIAKTLLIGGMVRLTDKLLDKNRK